MSNGETGTLSSGQQPVRLRPRPSQYLSALVVPSSIISVNASMNLWDHGSGSGDLGWINAGVAILVAALVLWTAVFQGVTLTETEIVIRSVRTRRVPWSQIQGLDQRRQSGSGWLRLWLEDGKSVALPTPRIAWPARNRGTFERDFHLIGQWWLEHRGPDWRPAW
jgi:hypothetical protein